MKYDNYTDFLKKSPGAYAYIMRNNLERELCKHITRKYLPKGYWNNKEKCKTESEKYKNRNEFQKNNYTAYNYSLINGWLDVFFI